MVTRRVLIKSFRYAQAIMLSENEWWITGGNDVEDTFDSTLIYDFSNGEFREFVDLPRWKKRRTLLNIIGNNAKFPGRWLCITLSESMTRPCC